MSEPISSDEILKGNFNNREMEGEYRRGYADGFYAAIQTLEVIGNLDKVRITDIMSKFYFGELHNWVLANLDMIVIPPGCFTKCVYCGNPADEIDHVHPRSKGGGNEIENLTPACHNCNRDKRDKSIEEWRNR